jgi:hypothetical protein
MESEKGDLIMRRMVFGFILIVVVTLSAAVARADDDSYNWYDYVGIYLAHDIDHHLFEARVSFMEKDYPKAASEIRTAIGLIKLERNRSKGKAYAALDDSIGKLDDLADDIEDGKVVSAKVLQAAFAEANHGLAMHHYENAQEAWNNQDLKTAFQALKTSQMHLERAITWSNHKKKEKTSAQEKKK